MEAQIKTNKQKEKKKSYNYAVKDILEWLEMITQPCEENLRLKVAMGIDFLSIFAWSILQPVLENSILV